MPRVASARTAEGSHPAQTPFRVCQGNRPTNVILAERLTPHPWRCFDQPLLLENEASLWDIPQFHIVCSSTLATRDADQMARARAEGRLWDVDTGHDLMITEPQFVADALMELAGK